MQVNSLPRPTHTTRTTTPPLPQVQVNNLLKFLMQLYFKPTTAKMLSNLKVRAFLPLCVLLSS